MPARVTRMRALTSPEQLAVAAEHERVAVQQPRAGRERDPQLAPQAGAGGDDQRLLGEQQRPALLDLQRDPLDRLRAVADRVREQRRRDVAQHDRRAGPDAHAQPRLVAARSR